MGVIGGAAPAIAAFMAVAVGLGGALRAEPSRVPAPAAPEAVAAAGRAGDVSFDPRNVEALPRMEKPVDVTLGEAAPWWPKGESPILGDLVAKGKLPPVSERVGPQPVVLDGGSLGSYGGNWLRV